MQNIIDSADFSQEQEEQFEKEYVNLYQVITRDERLNIIAKDVVEHFMKRGFMGKAMFVAIDKATAVKMYDKVKFEWEKYIQKLEKKLITASPDDREILQKDIDFMKETDMAVVVSPSQNEIEKMKLKGVDILPHRKRMNEEDLATKFKDKDDNLRLVFVCAMWVTGFDCPTISTLYLDKILKEHTLMQTIARANRVAEGKFNGIIVDYIGIFKALQKALAIYGSPDGSEISEEEDPAEMKAKLIELLDKEAINMKKILTSKNIEVNKIFDTRALECIKNTEDAVNRLLESEKDKNEFLKSAQNLKILFKAILPDAEARRYAKIVFVSTILYSKIKESLAKFVDKTEIKNLALQVEGLLNESITLASYQINAGEKLDLSKIDFEELQKRILKEKKLALLEKLKSAISSKLSAMVNLNSMRKHLQEKFEQIIEDYNNGKLTMEQMYVQLVALTNELTQEEKRHLDENLSEEELAILDILTKPEPKLSKKEFETVKAAAQKLITVIKKEKLVLDWRKKQSTRAKVKEAIETICDETLPEIYDKDLFQEKCNALYEHFYDYYNNAGDNIYNVA